MTEELKAMAKRLENKELLNMDITNAADMLRKAAQEIEALRHDLSRHIEIAARESGKVCPRGKESQARNEALEEAARVCEAIALDWRKSIEEGSEEGAYEEDLLRESARAIRALKTRDSQTVNELPASQDEHVQTDRCGFDRNASISENRYVCDCGWRSPEGERRKGERRTDRFQSVVYHDEHPTEQRQTDRRKPAVAAPTPRTDAHILEVGRIDMRTADFARELGRERNELEQTVAQLRSHLAVHEKFGCREPSGWEKGKVIATALKCPRLEREVARLRTALQTIQQWDCLNPPRADLLGDLPWLRRVVDAALKEPG